MENTNTFFKNPYKQKNLNFNKSFINHKFQNGQIFNNILNFEETEPKKKEKSIRYLLVKKINLKDTINNFYSKALNNIFSDINKYLEHYYDGKKIIVGKKCTSKGLKELRDYFFRKNRKKRTVRKNDLKSNLSFFNKIKSKSNNIFLDITKNNSTDTIKNMNMNMNLFSKKEYMTKYPLSDNELKIIFQESVEREKNNKNEKKDISSDSNADGNNQKTRHKLYNKISIKSANYENSNMEKMNINSMLTLQEKILKDRIKKDKKEKKIKNKLMSATLKENSKLLMNNTKDLIIIKNKKREKELPDFGLLNQEVKTMKNWLSELRTNNKEKKIKNLTKKEVIYYNKDINLSMDIEEKNNKVNLYKKINNNPLKIGRPSLFSKYKNQNNDNSYKIEKKVKNLSVDNAKDNKKNNLSIYHNLYVKGKNLLDHEIKLSKELFGKKKKIVHYSYGVDEISNILFAKSKSINNINTTKAIINSIEIHNLG